MGFFTGAVAPPFPFNGGVAFCFSAADAQAARWAFLGLGVGVGAAAGLIVGLVVSFVITFAGPDLVGLITPSMRLLIVVASVLNGVVIGFLAVLTFLFFSSCGCAPPAYAFCFCIYVRTIAGRPIIAVTLPCPSSCTILVPAAQRC